MSITYSCSVCGVKITMHRRIIGKPWHKCAKRMGRTYEMQANETEEEATHQADRNPGAVRRALDALARGEEVTP